MAWSAGAARMERELRAEHARSAARFDDVDRDPGRSAAARIKILMQACERRVPTALKGGLDAVCGERDAMTAAVGR